MPLFMFHNNNRKYKVAAYKGKCFACKKCQLKKELKGPVIQNVEGKWINVHYTKLQAIKRLFKS